MILEGKVIAITGAARGLGRCMAERLSGQGAHIALVDMDEGGLEETAAQCQRHGAQARAYVTDVSDETGVAALFSDIRRDSGTLDAFVNNAGIIRDGLLVKAKDGKVVSRLSLEDWQAVVNVDLSAVFLCGREAATTFIELGKPGVIINLSSISRAGNAGQSSYSAAKAGVAAMTVTWAKELARYGIRVAAVAPGFCDTAMVTSMPAKALDRVISGIPLRRLGEPAEIADSVIYLLENDYFTGRVLEVDGGLRL